MLRFSSLSHFLPGVLCLGVLAGCTGVAAPVPAASTPAGITPGAAYSATCYAGFYACPMPNTLPVGTRCTCPGLGAPSYGFVR